MLDALNGKTQLDSGGPSSTITKPWESHFCVLEILKNLSSGGKDIGSTQLPYLGSTKCPGVFKGMRTWPSLALDFVHHNLDVLVRSINLDF